ncbi:hypothetical protein [Maritalea mediterranea]|uniref:DUF2007 domain-containing protein n=1 Tax=Maritalea mediterranea TaxID=2909667 RepID=A0ABS9EEX3_9HYPH|nr:hypothetical protein [Maritalea mediterranea]MCF4100006.1 hypothetical protein [Maritalea mediterranea]
MKGHEMGLTTIAKIDDLGEARLLILALKSHGFHPIEGDEVGLAGFAGAIGPSGVPIMVPGGEAEDAKLLLDSLREDFKKDSSADPSGQ